MVPCQNNYLNEKATFIHLAESSRATNVCGVSSQAQVLYMCFDRFLLAVKSRDLSQADKSII